MLLTINGLHEYLRFRGLGRNSQVDRLASKTEANVIALLKKDALDAVKNNTHSITDRLSENTPTGRRLAALSGAWDWSETAVGSAKLSDYAQKIIWNTNSIPATQEDTYLNITHAINVGNLKADVRWGSYKDNVSHLLKGGNPYESMRSVLARLGVSTTAAKDYEQQFGLKLSARKPVQIGGQTPAKLMAAETNPVRVASQSSLTAVQQASIFEQAEPALAQLRQSSEEQSAMWIPDGQLAASLLAGITTAAVAMAPAQAADNYAVGVCRVDRLTEDGIASGTRVSPIVNADSYWLRYHANDARHQGFDFSGAKVTLLAMPEHGNVIYEDDRLAVELQTYHYSPTDGFVGADHFSVLIEKDGVKVRIEYVVEMIERNDSPVNYCNPETWKITSAPALDISNISSLLSTVGIPRAVGIDAIGLTGNALAQTSNTSITLDSTGAGHGWYLDPSPLDNTDDFLPTADKTIWRAKAGSAADGKMDLLSVLLHEYGHMLGLEHSGDSSDFMAATLQPGERRLPTEAELAWMAQRIAELKAASDSESGGNIGPELADPAGSAGGGACGFRQPRRAPQRQQRR